MADSFIEKFKAGFGELMGKSSDTMKSLFTSTKDEFDKMQESYSKGNKTKLDAYKKNYGEMKDKLKNGYDKAKADHQGKADSYFTQFKDNGKALFDKLTGTAQSAHEEASKALSEQRKAAEEKTETTYNDLVKDMDKNYEDTVKRLSIA